MRWLNENYVITIKNKSHTVAAEMVAPVCSDNSVIPAQGRVGGDFRIRRMWQ